MRYGRSSCIGFPEVSHSNRHVLLPQGLRITRVNLSIQSFVECWMPVVVLQKIICRNRPLKCIIDLVNGNMALVFWCALCWGNSGSGFFLRNLINSWRSRQFLLNLLFSRFVDLQCAHFNVHPWALEWHGVNSIYKLVSIQKVILWKTF